MRGIMGSRFASLRIPPPRQCHYIAMPALYHVCTVKFSNPTLDIACLPSPSCSLSCRSLPCRLTHARHTYFAQSFSLSKCHGPSLDPVGRSLHDSGGKADADGNRPPWKFGDGRSSSFGVLFEGAGISPLAVSRRLGRGGLFRQKGVKRADGFQRVPAGAGSAGGSSAGGPGQGRGPGARTGENSVRTPGTQATPVQGDYQRSLKSPSVAQGTGPGGVYSLAPSLRQLGEVQRLDLSWLWKRDRLEFGVGRKERSRAPTQMTRPRDHYGRLYQGTSLYGRRRAESTA